MWLEHVAHMGGTLCRQLAQHSETAGRVSRTSALGAEARRVRGSHSCGAGSVVGLASLRVSNIFGCFVLYLVSRVLSCYLDVGCEKHDSQRGSSEVVRADSLCHQRGHSEKGADYKQ